MTSAESVSVVIPTYNRAEVVGAAIESVLDQTVKPGEILVVDDGSRDNTGQVCQRFAARGVRYIRQENAGASAARNLGIREAAGEWIAFLDSDDRWETEKLEIQLQVQEATGAEWSITGFSVVDAANCPMPPSPGWNIFGFIADCGSPEAFFKRAMQSLQLPCRGSDHHVCYGDTYNLLFLGNFAMPSSAIVSKKALHATGLFDESLRVSEDTEFFHRLASSAAGAVVMTPLLRWRTGHSERQLSTRNSDELIETALISLDRAFRLRGEPSSTTREAYLQGKERLFVKLAYTRLAFYDGEAARKTLKTAWKNGVRISAPTAAIYTMSMLPTPCLKMMGAGKRVLHEKFGL